jgi:hypothetical protein
MKKDFRHLLALGFLLALGSALPASAQSVVCSRTLNVKTCDLLAEPLEAELRMLKAPAEWTWVILDGEDWRRASRMFKTEKITTAAFTVLELRTTFFSADYVQRRRPRPCVDVLAHELGHIACNCGSEMKAEKTADELIAQMEAN